MNKTPASHSDPVGEVMALADGYGDLLMRTLPTEEQYASAYVEGIDARLGGKSFKHNAHPCHYTYDNFQGMSYREFDAFKRPLLDAWFDGFLNKPLRKEAP